MKLFNVCANKLCLSLCYFPNCTKPWWIKAPFLDFWVGDLPPWNRPCLERALVPKMRFFGSNASHSHMILFHTCFFQARNELGTPRGAMSFLRGAKNIWTMSNCFKFCPKRSSRGEEKYSKGCVSPPALLVTVLASLHSTNQGRANLFNGRVICRKPKTPASRKKQFAVSIQVHCRPDIPRCDITRFEDGPRFHNWFAAIQYF